MKHLHNIPAKNIAGPHFIESLKIGDGIPFERFNDAYQGYRHLDCLSFIPVLKGIATGGSLS